MNDLVIINETLYKRSNRPASTGERVLITKSIGNHPSIVKCGVYTATEHTKVAAEGVEIDVSESVNKGGKIFVYHSEYDVLEII